MVEERGTPETLKRSLSLPLITLYGLGTTIGAGIFVLVGKVAGVAGGAAPAAFLLAALLAGMTALAFAEFAGRFPQSAGEAVYIREGLRVAVLPAVVGLLVASAGLISAAAISKGFVGYLHEFVVAPEALSIIVLVVALGLLAAWGIAESVTFAALFTLAEIAALLLVIAGGADTLIARPAAVLGGLMPELGLWPGVFAGAVLAFYAFIGFEDMVNVAEEVRDVRKVLPRAIVLTLIVTTLLYVLVASVAVLVVAPAELAESAAPLALVYETATGRSAAVISLIAIFAVVNGALIQIIMASRVLYGLSRMSYLPAVFGRVHRWTRTPLLATAVVAALVLLLALFVPIVRLAETTSFATLLVFAVVNLALVALKRRPEAETWRGFRLPIWLPALGAAVSLAFAGYQLARFAGLV